MHTPTLREWLREAPFTLAMSSGFFGFYAHAGALAALEDAGLTAQGYAGSSAGALVTGLRAGGVSPDAMRTTLEALRRDDFWDPAPGLGLLRGDRFRTMLHGLVGDARIETLGAPWRGSVWQLATRRTCVLERGSLAAAIHASCALPALFQPVVIDGARYLDGGIEDRPGLAGVPDGTRTLHHHLASRSPWRREGSSALRPPRRANLTAVSVHGITRVNPFALERGALAWTQSHDAMRASLDAPVRDGLIERSL